MAASNRLVLMCKTYGGFAVRIVILVGAAVIDPSGSVVAAIRAAIEAICKVQITSASITATGAYSLTGASGAYEDDQDKASLTFVDAVGKYHTFKVPAPKPSIFLEGDNIVDLDNTAIQAFGAYLVANFKSRTGAALVRLVKGRRIRLKAGGRY